MINFRYHIVSLIAVFLALGIGIIMGTAVIDRAVVDRLERQQVGLQSAVDDVQAENERLRTELGEEREVAQQLAEEGSDLLGGSLAGVPVVVIGPRGEEAEGLDDLVSLLVRSDADYRGTIWLTDRFVLDDEEERRDLTQVLEFREGASAATLREAAMVRVARALRPSNDPLAPPQDLLVRLRETGFLDYDAPEGVDGDTLPVLDPGARVVAVSDPAAVVPDDELMIPLVRALTAFRSDLVSLPVLAVGDTPAEGEEDSFIAPIREDEVLAGNLSTVDDIDDFAGRLASVFALVQLGEGRTGHYGRGPGAQRLLPAPAE